MKTLLAVAVLAAGAAAIGAPASGQQPTSSEPAPNICVLFQQQRSGSRRICLSASEWQQRLGRDWRQYLSGRTVDDDLALLGTLTRSRSEPVLRDGCMACREMPPPRQD